MHRFFFLCFLVFFVPQPGKGQQYSYSRYDVKDGLAGSNVYTAIQDQKGFIWFGTETGLSRFDGTRFTNFTVADGLPDNEIINLFCDSKGRVWIVPFSKSICYYSEGKIHNQENDSLLGKLSLLGNVFSIAENEDSAIALMELGKIQLIYPNGRIQVYSDSGHVSGGFTGIAGRAGGDFWLFTKQSVGRFNGSAFAPVALNLGYARLTDVALFPSSFIIGTHSKAVFIGRNGQVRTSFPFNDSHVSYSVLNDSLLSDNTRDGARIYNIHDPGKMTRYLEGRPVLKTLLDNEGEYWFCTRGEGVYKLNPAGIRTLTLPISRNTRLGVEYLFREGNSLLVGSNMNKVLRIHFGSKGVQYSEIRSFGPWPGESVIKSIGRLPDRRLYCASEFGIQFAGVPHIYWMDGAIKEVKAEDSFFLVSQSNSVVKVFFKGRSDTVGVWYGRSTTASLYKDTLLVGTLEGLYRKDLRVQSASADMGIDTLFTGRISSIVQADNGYIWIGTNGDGLLLYRHGRIVARLRKSQGLTSDICRKLYWDGKVLWVGTDRGLNSVQMKNQGFSIRNIHASDGLLSDFITAIVADDSMVYVGSSEGLSYFRRSGLQQSFPCLLRIRSVVVSGKKLDSPVQGFTLNRIDNNIRFEYSGLSFRSGGDIYYRYFLEGLDTAWKETREDYLNYPTLQPGHYVMHIMAVNRFGMSSQEITLPFRIKYYWWERWQYQLAGMLILLGGGIFLINRRIRNIRREENERLQIREKMIGLEQMALRAQMNPHFIFNSLNSIQHFVLQKDIMGANKYLSGLSRLIRLTLDYSACDEIPARDELDFIRIYLELEKSRMSDKFNYEFDVSDAIRQSDDQVPPLILQPFVENSIRHGIRYRSDKDGLIQISAWKSSQAIHFIVRDNGVGRALAAEFNKTGSIGYQSRGIELTRQRISLLSRKGQVESGITIRDLQDAAGQPAGTEVEIILPV